MNDNWFFRPQPNPNARRRLFCFPYAGGGGAVYRGWPAGLPADVELWALRLPGRENRLRQTPFDNWPALLAAVETALRPHLDRPFFFFGHSLGALIAYEMTIRLRAAGGLQPAHLFVSGHRAPQLPAQKRPIHQLPDAAFEGALADLNGIPAPVLASRELMDLVRPMLRADMTLAETYAYEPGPKLTIPITAAHGQADTIVTEAEMAAWGERTMAAFDLKVFTGDHFFWQPAPASLLALIGRKMGGG